MITAGGNLVSVALAPNQATQPQGQLQFSGASVAGQPTFTFSPHPPANVVSSTQGTSTLVSVVQQPQISTQIVDGSAAATATHQTVASTPGGATVQLNPVPVDLPSVSTANSEESGVLLCNLDELSRYIPENFYSDFTIADQAKVPDYLETVIAGKGITTTVSASQLGSANSIPAGQTLIQPQNILPLCSMSAASPIITSPATSTVSTTTAQPQPQQLTIQLPTQPQPIQGVKTLTYVNPVKTTQIQVSPSGASTLQPVKLATPTFAFTPSGERIAIQGIPDGSKSQFQVQVKPGTSPQTLQLQGMAIEPPKLTVLQELPEVGKVVVQETRPQSDSISNILEEMKCGEEGGFSSNGIEYTTAIPVAVSSVASDPKKTTIKRVAAPASTVILPNNRSRGIILAGNGLPQGAIPIKINGMNAVPLSAVKSLPQINLSNLTPCTNVITSPPIQTQVVSAKKTKVEVINKASLPQNPLPPQSILTKVVSATNNNLTQKMAIGSPDSDLHNTSTSPNRSMNNNTPLTSKTVGNNKTCNWVFENGEICGKTFSKSYNLVVHMRMHEDVRPFCCSLCDQTFRQKAHLQRHETTHGIGVKVGRSGVSGSKRKRKRSRSSSNIQTTQVVLPTAPLPPSEALQKRLAHVNEKFGNTNPVTTVVTTGHGLSTIVTDITKNGVTGSDDDEELTVMKGNRNYSKRGSMDRSEDGEDGEEEDDDDVEGSLAKMHRLSPPMTSAYVEVNDEVAVNLKEQDMIEDLTPEVTSEENTQKTILSVLLDPPSTSALVSTIDNKITTTNSAVTSMDTVRVESQPEISAAQPNTISPEMITAISGGKVTPENHLIQSNGQGSEHMDVMEGMDPQNEDGGQEM